MPFSRYLLLMMLSVLWLGCASSTDTKPDANQQKDVVTTIDTSVDSGPDLAQTDDLSDQKSEDQTPEPDKSEEKDNGWDPEVGCQVDGQLCDDGNPCTHSDACNADGVCKGVAYTCDDGRECTDDKCDGNGYCKFEIKPGKCFINGVCIDDGTVNPKNPCVECDIKKSNKGWSADDSNSCEDESVCTLNSKCQNGRCVFDAKNCDDQNPCTTDSCHPKTGCSWVVREGPCEDGDLCNGTEMCIKGKCEKAPAPTECDDQNPCTEDDCDSKVGCVHKPLSGSCEVQNKCVTVGTCKDGICDIGQTTSCSNDDECDTKTELCFKGECVKKRNCDDGNSCTTDQCAPSIGCYTQPVVDACCTGSVSVCNDNDACTTDLCVPGDPPTCDYKQNTASCDDGDPCTVNDDCSTGVCKGTPKNCNDGNSCTTDSCVAGNCVHQEKTGSCDDGKSCSTNDTCVAGKCVGDETGCACTPSFSPNVARITTMAIGANGKPGEGLNVDETDSCAPSSSCSNGIDNAMAGFAALANAQLQKALDDGALILLLELKNLKFDGSTFPMSLHTGVLDPANASCNPKTQTCQYKVSAAGIDSVTCVPKITLDNTKISANTLTAGGASTQYSFYIEIPLSEGLSIPINILYAHVEATITKSGDSISNLSGLIGGAVVKEEMLAAIDAIPDEQFAELGFSKDIVKNILNLAVKSDLTINGKEAASIGLKFTAIKGVITGTSN